MCPGQTQRLVPVSVLDPVNGVVSEMRDTRGWSVYVVWCGFVPYWRDRVGGGGGVYLQLACLAWPVSMTTHPRDHNHD